VSEGKTPDGTGYASPMVDLLTLLIRSLLSLFRPRTALIVENLLLCQQLQLALHPKRRLRLQERDRRLPTAPVIKR
jgi:hypothetical protein